MDFAQSREMFMSLQGMGKPADLLEYIGADHFFSTPLNQKAPEMVDANGRILQFFDHFLKGSPAPKWWSDGVSYDAGTVPAVSPALRH